MIASWSKTIQSVLACGPRVLFLPTKQSARPIYSHDNATWKSSIDECKLLQCRPRHTHNQRAVCVSACSKCTEKGKITGLCLSRVHRCRRSNWFSGPLLPRPQRKVILHHNACSRGRYPTSERPRSLSRQNDLGRYLARTTLRHVV